MNIDVIDEGLRLKILFDNKPLHVVKGQVRTVTLVRNTIVQLDLGLGPLRHVWIPHADVRLPVFNTPGELLQAIAMMLDTVNPTTGSGGRDGEEEPPPEGA